MEVIFLVLNADRFLKLMKGNILKISRCKAFNEFTQEKWCPFIWTLGFDSYHALRECGR